jgi:hypothetical protein
MRKIILIAIASLLLSSQSLAVTFNVTTTAELRQALTIAATNNENDTIVLADGVYRPDDDNGGVFVYLSNESFTLTLSGSSSENVTIDGAGIHSLMSFRSTETGSNIYINDISLANGIGEGDVGAAITTNQILHFNGSTIRDNVSQSSSGGVLTTNRIYVTNSSFLNNSSSRDEITENGTYQLMWSDTYAAIKSEGGGVFITGSHFENNEGNIIKARGGYIKNSTFHSNIIVASNSLEPYSAGSDILRSDFGFVIDGIEAINPDGLVYGNRNCIYLGNAFSNQIHTLTNSVLVNCGFSSYGNVTHTSNSLFKSDYFSVASLNTVYNSIFIKTAITNFKSIFNFQNSYIDTFSTIYNSQDIVSENMLPSNAELGFVDIDNNNFNLTISSALIDSGTGRIDGFSLPELDFGKNARVSGGNIDIGPYEYPSTAPSISTFSFTGTAQEQSELTFITEYSFADRRSIKSVEFDYGNGYVSNNSFTFNNAGDYSITVRVTDDAGEFSTTSLSVTVAELPWEEMTFEQRLIDAIPANRYDDIVLGISTERIEATQSGREYVQDNPSEFSLVSIEALAPSQSDINELGIGWSLISTSMIITDLTIFNNVKVIWIYVDGAWQGWSSDQNILGQIELDANYNLITSIPRNSGIWVLK